MQVLSDAQAESLMTSEVQFGEGYAPGHITGFFTVHISEDPKFTGSKGAGICLDAGVTTHLTIRRDERTEFVLFWNGVAQRDSEVSKSVIWRFFGRKPKLLIVAEQRSILPPGYGYGVSGASALSLAFAANKALGSPLTKDRVGEIAHLAEVENLTGLGDVAAQMVGGFEVRLSPGAPTVGKVLRLQDPDGYVVLTTPVKPLPTNKLITNHLAKINEQGEFAISSFMKSPTVEAFVNLSRGFWERIMPTDPEIAGVLKKYESFGVELVSLKKGLVYGLVHEDDIGRVLGRVSPKIAGGTLPLLLHEQSSGLPVIVTKLSSGGAH